MTVPTLDPAASAPVDGPSRAAALLAAHVPLSLLLDLADPSGPRSDDLMTAEPGTADWLR